MHGSPGRAARREGLPGKRSEWNPRHLDPEAAAKAHADMLRMNPDNLTDAARKRKKAKDKLVSKVG